MNLQLYSYANIVRILYIDEDEFSQSIIIDINTDNGEILSIFDASKQFLSLIHISEPTRH